MIDFYNRDCLEALKEYPDEAFDLAIVDPPYGAGLINSGGRAGWFTRYKPTSENSEAQSGYFNRFGEIFDRYKPKDSKDQIKDITWDIAPPDEYFTELFRVAKNVIIWGGNYFNLPPCRCFLIWLKDNIPEKFTMAMCEYAWTSFNDNAKVFKYTSFRTEDSGKFHPTEKPIALYKWLLTNYANKGDKILDTHVGSASSLIACYDLGFDAVGFEIDKTYYEAAKKRLEDHQKQVSIFDLIT